MNVQFYDPNKVDQWGVPNYAAALAEGESHRRMVAKPSGETSIAVLIDIQKDFVLTGGALQVPGAIGNTKLTTEWLVDRTQDGTLTNIAASLDSHVPIQIFHPIWWMDKNGNSPAPFTAIDENSLLAGEWRPRVKQDATTGEDLEEWSINYVQALGVQAKKPLMIWPYHTLIGTPGQTLVDCISEAIAYHTGVRGSQPTLLAKGDIPKTEFYSILEPEIKVHDHEKGGLNTGFLDMMGNYDKIYIFGQAKSHCVLESMESVVRYFKGQRSVLSRIYFMMDCTSSVYHPQIDFEAMANARLAEFEKMGVQMVQTTDWK